MRQPKDGNTRTRVVDKNSKVRKRDEVSHVNKNENCNKRINPVTHKDQLTHQKTNIGKRSERGGPQVGLGEGRRRGTEEEQKTTPMNLRLGKLNT